MDEEREATRRGKITVADQESICGRPWYRHAGYEWGYRTGFFGDNFVVRFDNRGLVITTYRQGPW